jgi:hypothetical protein
MTGIKVCLATAAAAAVNDVLPDSPDLLTLIIQRGSVVAILLVGIAAIYAEGKKRQDKLEQIIERNAEASTKLADASSKQAEATFQMSAAVKEVITRCHDSKIGPPPTLPEIRR